MDYSVVLPVQDPSQVSEARREATALARSFGFEEIAQSQIAIIASELATNLINHVGQGEIVVRRLDAPNTSTGTEGLVGIELLSLDRGPGIPNVSASLRDGFSTAGTAGNGLGAIQRLSSLFDINSVPGKGTAVLSRCWADPARKGILPGNEVEGTGKGLQVGAVSVAYAGEIAPGDAWATHTTSGNSFILVADGLGHGPQAATAAREAVRIFRESMEQDSPTPTAVIEKAHGALRSTRGAALAVARLNFEKRVVTFAGVGNIAGGIWDGQKLRSMVSHNGTVGAQFHRIQEFEYPWPLGALLIFHSDGIATQWRIEGYPGLITRHPAVVAGTLYRDYRRPRDDSTVVALSER